MYGGDVCCFYFDDTISIHLNNLELLTLILQVNSGYYLRSTEDSMVCSGLLSPEDSIVC